MWLNSRGLSLLLLLGLPITWSTATATTKTTKTWTGIEGGSAVTELDEKPADLAPSLALQDRISRWASTTRLVANRENPLDFWANSHSQKSLRRREDEETCATLPIQVCPNDSFVCAGCSTCCLDGNGSYQCCPRSSSVDGLPPAPLGATTTTVFKKADAPTPEVTTVKISTITQTLTIVDPSRGITTSTVSITTACPSSIRVLRGIPTEAASPDIADNLDNLQERRQETHLQRPVITFTITTTRALTASSTATVTITQLITVSTTITVGPKTTTTVLSTSTICSTTTPGISPPGATTTITVPPSWTITITPITISLNPGTGTGGQTTTSPGSSPGGSANPTSTTGAIPASSGGRLNSDQIAIISVGVILGVVVLVVGAILLRFLLQRRKRRRAAALIEESPHAEISRQPFVMHSDDDSSSVGGDNQVRIVVRPATARREERTFPVPPGHEGGERFSLYVDPTNNTSASGGDATTQGETTTTPGGSLVVNVPRNDEHHDDGWSMESAFSSPSPQIPLGPAGREEGRPRRYGATWFGGSGIGRAV